MAVWRALVRRIGAVVRTFASLLDFISEIGLMLFQVLDAMVAQQPSFGGPLLKRSLLMWRLARISPCANGVYRDLLSRSLNGRKVGGTGIISNS
jgi:hypothetical protein